ncbi:MAG: sigma 54-interacting transcriptional regulator [Acidobacteriota bacterium]
MARSVVSLDEKRRILQLETLYDLAVALHAERSEGELIEELLQQVCAVLDPAAAVAATRDLLGGARAVATVGWRSRPPTAAEVFDGTLWRDLLGEGRTIERRDGSLAGRDYRQAVAVPLAYRGTFLGYLALLDKESRHAPQDEIGFSEGDRRFLESVASLAGVALDGARRFADLSSQRERLEEENRALKGRLVEELEGHRIVAGAEPMRRALEVVERVAPRNVNLLLRGESGTGKELIARLAHSLSGRPGPLVAINCAAIPETLLESELFGIEGGVATGVAARRGKFELADGGTLFLDEIGDLDLTLQVKLLRALQEREVVHVGGDRPISVDVRLIAATHRDLEERVQAGAFRQDLYYRLKGVDVAVPPLRQRRQDIPQLVRLFLEEFCRRERIEPPTVTPEALAALLAHDYPGNVRELQNLVESAAALSDGSIDEGRIESLVGGGRASRSGALDLATVERRHIEKVLRMTRGNKSAAARLLGVDRRTLQRKGH